MARCRAQDHELPCRQLTCALPSRLRDRDRGADPHVPVFSKELLGHRANLGHFWVHQLPNGVQDGPKLLCGPQATGSVHFPTMPNRNSEGTTWLTAYLGKNPTATLGMAQQ